MIRVPRAKCIPAIALLFFCICFSACRKNSGNHPASNSNDWFRDVSETAHVSFFQNPGGDGNYFMPESLGSGAAFFDYNNDGRLDIFLVNASPHGKPNTTAKNRLYQQQPDGTFKDMTDLSGVGDTGFGTGAAAGDFDNDGYLDLYVANFGADKLYRNNGNGTFTDVTGRAGIAANGWSASVIFFDYDLDGFLDIYAAQYLNYNPSVQCTDKAGRKEYCGPKGFSGSPDILYHNNGNGTFSDVTAIAGIATPRKGLGVLSLDFDRDGYPDVFVANDGEPNELWINQRDGTFRDQADLLGAAVNAAGQPEANMGIAVGDVDGDQDVDLFLTHLREEKNTFYRNLGKAGFEDDSWPSGLAAPSIPYTGFGTGMIDYDNDGDLDIAVANGRIARGPLLVKSDHPSYWDDYAEPNLLFDNNGKGHYQNVSAKAGSFCDTVENSRALAFGDYDNDGGVDMLLTNCGGPARLYHNEIRNRGHWLLVRALDPALKRDAIGAKITVIAGSRRIVRWVAPGYSYFSSNDARAHFGLGSATAIERVIIDWPGGRTETFSDIAADRVVTLLKGNGKTS